MKLLTSAVKSLPQGTLRVAIGLGVLGAASYVHLAVAGHALPAKSMASVSVLWTIAFSIGYGFYTPVEQEITRVVAARKVGDAGAAPVLRRGAVLAAGILAFVVVVVGAAAKPIADRLFNGDLAMVGALAGAFLGLAATAVTRGVLAGLGMFRDYGAQLAVDGGLRIVLALGLGVAGVRHAMAYSLILTVAPLCAAAYSLRSVLRAALPGPQIAWHELYRGLGLLIVSTMLSQVVVNIAVINVKLLDPGKVELVSALLSAIVLARVPLFVFSSLQTSLLPGLSSAHAEGDMTAFRRLIVRTSGVVVLLGLSGGLVASLLGPKLVHVLFGAPNVLGTADFAWFSLGTLAYMLALVLGQGLMAQDHHRDQLVGWVTGTTVLAVITFMPGDIKLRVEAAYLCGAGVVAAMMALLLVVRARRSGPRAGATSPAGASSAQRDALAH